MLSNTLVLFLCVLCVVSAQMNECLKSCMYQSLTATSCQAYDTRCLCSDTRFIDAAMHCIGTSCTPQEIKQADELLNQLCKGA
ncbi:hypothetical protein K501DRAFT_283527 [Backusella circina FSU 941]|nr:hypothetical protein K501DRAFT_283527 [Backusella circina FSU 941]